MSLYPYPPCEHYREDEEPEPVEPDVDEPVDRCGICGDPNPNHFPPAPNVCFACWSGREREQFGVSP